SVAKRVGSEATTRRLNRVRRRMGQQIVMSEGAVRGMLRALRAREWVAILQDQYTDPYLGGLWVDFLGLPSAVSGAAARLALKTGATVGVIYAHALSDGRYRCRLLGECAGRSDEDAQTLTQRLTVLLTGAIRRHPSQWLLMYKRWKRWPAGADYEHYPFYAAPWSHAEAQSVYGKPGLENRTFNSELSRVGR
ncbi:MAG: lysophospholipid acyltransferase family protein, partial [Kiritimatiellae bacterium]|nr:lysophospholipid acyltransferase family protein [Kiritimatiellia bacterium]